MDGKHENGDGSQASEAGDVSRRECIGGTSAALVVAGASPLGVTEAHAAELADQQQATDPPRTRVRLTVNGSAHDVEVEDRWTLNELLRDELQLIGSKLGCNRGECGACTVQVNGEALYSCSTLAVWADGKDVVTVEGLANGNELSPLQEAFIANNAPQCGFCIPGQLMAATVLLENNPSPSEEDVRQGLAGNLCRCSNYNYIVEAVMAASGGGR